MQHEVHLVNYGSVKSKIDDKSGFALVWLTRIRISSLAPPSHRNKIASGSKTSIWQRPYMLWCHRGLTLGLYTTDFITY